MIRLVTITTNSCYVRSTRATRKHLFQWILYRRKQMYRKQVWFDYQRCDDLLRAALLNSQKPTAKFAETYCKIRRNLMQYIYLYLFHDVILFIFDLYLHFVAGNIVYMSSCYENCTPNSRILAYISFSMHFILYSWSNTFECFYCYFFSTFSIQQHFRTYFFCTITLSLK